MRYNIFSTHFDLYAKKPPWGCQGGFFRMDTIEVRILLVSKTGAAEAAPVV